MCSCYSEQLTVRGWRGGCQGGDGEQVDSRGQGGQLGGRRGVQGKVKYAKVSWVVAADGCPGLGLWTQVSAVRFGHQPAVPQLLFILKLQQRIACFLSNQLASSKSMLF